MVTLKLLTATGIDALNGYHTLAEALSDARHAWNEDEAPDGTFGPQMLFVTDEADWVLATMMRDESDHEICHTLYTDGTSESHRCHYRLTADGGFDGCEVTVVIG